MKVFVLGGGDSPEREVSLRSAAAVAHGARELGHNVIELDPADGYEILDQVPEKSVVLPILHGKGGEDGSIQKEMEKRKLSYLGSDSQASAKCFDKWQTRTALEKAGLPVAEGYLVKAESYSSNPLSKRPHVLKVPHGGSSIGTLIVRNPSTVKQEDIDEVFSMEDCVVLEELIEGTETTVPILDGAALTPLEIIPPEGSEFDYENKYNGRTKELCPPVSVLGEIQSQCKQLSKQVHQLLGCRHLSRVDLMIGDGGRVVVLEINTIPGLTDQSLFPKSALVSGLTMDKLVGRFIDLVKRDYAL